MLRLIFSLFVTSPRGENRSVRIIRFRARLSYLLSSFGRPGRFLSSVEPVSLYLFIISLTVLVGISSRVEIILCLVPLRYAPIIRSRLVRFHAL